MKIGSTIQLVRFQEDKVRPDVNEGNLASPEVLLLDEHTAALDPKSADQVIALTDMIIRRDKLMTLMVTHSMQQAVNLGDRLIMMHRGRFEEVLAQHFADTNSLSRTEPAQPPCVSNSSAS